MRRAINRDLLAAGAIALAVHAVAYVALCGLPGPVREIAAPRVRRPIAVVLVGAPAMETMAAADPAGAEPETRAVARTPKPASPEPTELPVERVAPRPSAPMSLDVRASAAPGVSPAPPTVALARAARPPAALDTPAMPTAAPFAAPGALPESIRAARATSIDPPTALRNDPPRYPRAARQRGHEGTVDLRIHVLTSGRSDTVEIKRSSGYVSLDRAAVRAAETWRFEPASDRGRPIAMWIEIPVEFNLKETP